MCLGVLLEQCAEGVICLSGGPSGPLNAALLQGQVPLAQRHCGTLAETLFGDRFYIELQRHGLETEACHRTRPDRTRL